MALKKGPKFILIGLVGVAAVLGIKHGMNTGLIPTPGIGKATSVSKVTLQGQTDAQVANVVAVPMPSTSQANVSNVRIPINIWEWNAYSATIFANGGVETTKGSLMEKYNVNLALLREDSNTKMKENLVKCAEELMTEKTCTVGVAGIIVMGDSGAQWLADLNPQLKKYKTQAIIIGAVGRSNGEDALLGPQSWKTTPSSMKGGTVVGVIRDGDWNIALNFMAANGLKNNPDLTTYDADAVNWISAPDDDYIKAVTEVYMPNRCEDRRVVKDGHPTGEKKNVCPDGVVTWTPGDEQAVHGRQGTYKIVSSHEFSSQMPSVIIMLKNFANNNREEVQNLLAASFQAADQVKAFDEVRKRAGAISAKVYNDQNGDYWYKYFIGFVDPASRQPLGGSAVFNLEDNINFFGLDGKHNNNMRATYDTFKRIDLEQYPQFFTKNPMPDYKDAVDTTFIFGAQSALSSNGVQNGGADETDYTAVTNNADATVVGHTAVYINFALNSDKPLPESIPTLIKLKDALALNQALAIQLDGFTDNSGNDARNIPLSESRAAAVKAFFQTKAPLSFPDSRFKSVKGHGSQNPISNNPALNRRVEVTQLGQ